MAWLVLLASLAVTIFAWYFVRAITLESANERFVFQSQKTESALRERLHAYEFLLQSGAGFFAGSEEVTRSEWRTYVTALQIDKHYPGVQGLGFAKRVLPAEKQAHIRQIREKGFPDYEIQPAGERPEYTSIIFLEPFDWRNQRAFGYDMFSEPTRRAAMAMARDTGSPALSGKITLLQETEKDVQAGFLMYLPVYRNGEAAETPEQRREALTGYVYSPFRMNDLMQGLLIEKRGAVDLQVFDGDEALKEALLYPSGNLESGLSHSGHAHLATYQSILEYAGRRWLLVFNSSSNFEKTINTGQVNSILLLGSIISLLLFFVALSSTRPRNQALSLANMSFDLEKSNLGLRREIEERKQVEEKIRQLNDELEGKVLARTHQLLESQALLSTVFDSVQDGIVLVDTETWQHRMSNVSFQRMLGYSADEILELGVTDIHPKEEMDDVKRKFEQHLQNESSFAPDIPVIKKDGSIFYTDINTSPIMVKEAHFLLAVFRDITERRQAELTLKESEEKYRGLFENSRDALMVARPPSWHFTEVNRAALELFGAASKADLTALGPWDISPERQPDGRSSKEKGQELGTMTLREGSLLFEWELRCLNGETFTASVLGTRMGPKGQRYLQATVRDISERKAAEKALQDQFHLLQVLLDAIPAPVFHKDTRGVYTGCNKAFEAYLGKEKDQIVGKSVYDMAPKELAETYHQMDMALFGEQGTQIYESSVVYADGTKHNVIFNKAAFHNKDGSLGGLVGVILDITTLKQAEEVLRFKNTVLSILQQTSPSAILVVDENARVVSYNEQFIQLWGLPKELVGAGLDEPVLRKVTEQIENPGEFLTRVKYLYDHKNETSRDLLRLLDGRIIDRHSSPIADNDGRYYGRVWDFRDITELKRSTEQISQLNTSLQEKIQQLLTAQEELQQYRAHLEKEVAQRTARLTEAQRIAHLGNWEWDLINNKVNWSDEMYRIFGYAPQQISGSYEAFLNAVHPEDRQLVDDSARAALKRQHRYNIEHRILQPEGTLRYVHGQAEVLQGENGQPVSMLGTYHDITERKLAEQAAIEERNFSNTLIASQPDIFYVLDQTGRFIRWNNKLRDLLGYSDSQMATTNALDVIHEPDRPSVAQKTQETFDLGTATNVARLITKTGIRDFSLTASRVDTAKGAYAVGVGTDITELKQTEEKIRNLNEELEDKVRERTKQLMDTQEELVRKEKLALLGQVAGSVGHELRNPLAVMNNAVYFLKTVLTDADETTRDYLEIFTTEIDAADRIVSDLLDSVRTRPAQPAAVSVRELINQTLRKVNIPDSITLTLDLPKTLPPVRVDARQIQQVFRNLINNGVEAMAEGGTLSIRALENRPEDTVAVSVHDNGSGIAPEMLDKLFQPLFTTKARGIGLGLVVVKNLTQANGGMVRVESAIGQGTTFTLALPRDNPEGRQHARE